MPVLLKMMERAFRCIDWQVREVRPAQPFELRIAEAQEARFAAYVEALRRGAGPCRSTGTDARLLPGTVDADRAQECRADGGSDSTGAGRREASILAAFCGQCTMVGRCDAGQGGPARVAGDRA